MGYCQSVFLLDGNRSYKNKSLPSILLLNARSLRNKFSELCVLKSVYNPHIIATTETWFNDSIDSDPFSMTNYSFFRDDRQSRIGGGVCLWCHNFFTPEILPSYKQDFIEHLVIYLRKVSIFVIVIYIPPSLLANQRLMIDDFLVDVLERCLSLNPDGNLIVCGDFNNFDTRDLALSYSLENKVIAPTRGNNILDMIFMTDSLSEYYPKADILSPLCTSDHNCLLLRSPNDATSTPVNKIRHVTLDLRKSNVDLFLNKLSTANFTVMYRTTNIEDKVDIFYSIIYECMRCLPKYTVFLGTDDKPWITPYLKHLINLRWDAFRRQNFPLYNHYKLKVKKEIAKAKSRWALKSNESSKNLWDVVNEFRGTKRKGDLDSILVNFPDVKSAVNHINDAFTIGSNSYDTPQEVVERESHLVHRDLSSDSWCPLVEVCDIFKLLSKVNPKKATGSDEIPNILIREGAVFLSEPLCHLINSSILEGYVPLKWKSAKITPVPKTRPPKIESLRPISLLPTFSKVLERIVLSKTQHYLLSKVSPNQYAYKPYSSVTNALIMIHDKITDLLEDRDTIGVAVLQLDFSRAFDTISHERLLMKLQDMHFPIDFVKWASSYLSERTQYTVINNVPSKRKPLRSGVPQGSIIGPYLFILYTSDLLDFPDSIKYADDTTLIHKITGDIVASIRTLTSYVNEVHSYCRANAMRLNIEKSKLLVVPKKSMDCDITGLTLPGVQMVDHMKILGVTFSKDLSWQLHYDDILRRANRRLYALRVVNDALNDQGAVFKVFIALIRSLIEFASPLFVALPEYLNDKLLRFFKRCHRIVHGFACECDIFLHLVERRYIAASKLFKAAEENPEHALHQIIPERLPRSNQYYIKFSQTTRRRKCFTQFMPMYLNKMTVL